MCDKNLQSKPENEKAPYEAPAIVYEGTITTRAGSPIGGGSSDGVDVEDLFNTD